MSKLFHYTSNEGAIGIIQTQCLFATHYRFLNDTEELQLIRGMLEPIFESEFRYEYQRLVQAGQANDGLERDHGPNIYQQEARRLIAAGLKVTDRVTPVFITSFCRHEEGGHEWENGLLSQWRGYGSMGGCALQFDEASLGDLIEHERNTYAHTTVKLSDVVYENHEVAFDAETMRGLARAFFTFVMDRSEQNRTAYDERIFALHGALAVIAPTLKKAAFREERETRILVPSMIPAAAAEYPDRPRRPTHIRYRAGLPVPFIKLFADGAPLPIERIIVGPQQSQDRVRMALELVLNESGRDCTISESDISYLP